jgi:glutamine synthetase
MSDARSPKPAAVAPASRAELDAFLDAHPEIQFFDVLFTSLSGVPRGKRLRRHELAGVYDYGRFLPGSILVVDITGQDCESTGLVWEDGDADRVGRPVPGTLVPAPWLGADVAQVSLSIYELDGRPNDLDPRVVLQRVIDRFTRDGLTPVAACELEYYLVDARRAADGGLALAPSRFSGERPSLHQVYGLPEIEEAAPFLRDLWAACDAQDVPLEGAISEYAPGQIELTLKHKADALRAADDAVMYKRAAKGVALTHGCEATFMAKPFGDRAGSGFHVHVSFNDAAGQNVCASEDPQGSELLRHAIGGMRALLADSMAIFAPNANSWRRFKANSYAPVAPTWGVNNRTVSLRVPAGPPSTRHVEHRVAGADANPYLTLAAVLAAAHYGVTNKLDPGPAVSGDGYAAAAESGEGFALNWFAAVDRFAASDVLKDYLGERFVKMFAEVKRTEQARFFDVVTELDYAWYLRNA